MVLEGALSDVELERVRTILDSDGLFIAEQIGVPALYQKLYQWSGGATRSDHCWHEFQGVSVINEAEVPPQAYLWGTAGEFLNMLGRVRTWDEQLSPHFRADL